jgi:hypothetical protein
MKTKIATAALATLLAVPAFAQTNAPADTTQGKPSSGPTTTQPATPNNEKMTPSGPTNSGASGTSSGSSGTSKELPGASDSMKPDSSLSTNGATSKPKQ